MAAGQPENRNTTDAAANLLALEVPPACREGIFQNLSLLRTHFAIVEAAQAASGAEKGPAE